MKFIDAIFLGFDTKHMSTITATSATFRLSQTLQNCYDPGKYLEYDEEEDSAVLSVVNNNIPIKINKCFKCYATQK